MAGRDHDPDVRTQRAVRPSGGGSRCHRCAGGACPDHGCLGLAGTAGPHPRAAGRGADVADGDAAGVRSGHDAPGAEGSIRKLVHAELTERVGRLATELEPLGAVAWDAGEPMPEATRQFLAGKTFSIAGGTSEIQRNIIGERVLGLPKDPDPERELPFAERARG
ncbi:MAG: hypothetical protein GEV09_15695 [Pseudonocardiaceae bacterium]|nr:hypothetical protein [Pseudonocardiaceae bacterium]